MVKILIILIENGSKSRHIVSLKYAILCRKSVTVTRISTVISSVAFYAGVGKETFYGFSDVIDGKQRPEFVN